MIEVHSDFLIAIDDLLFPDYRVGEGEVLRRLCPGLVFRDIDCSSPGLIQFIRYQGALEVNRTYFMVNKFLEFRKVCVTAFFVELFGGFGLLVKVDSRAVWCLATQAFLFVESRVTV